MQIHPAVKHQKRMKVATIILALLLVILATGLIVKSISGNALELSEEAVIPQVSPDQRERYENLSTFVQQFYDQYFSSPEDGASVSDVRQTALNGFGDEYAMANFVSHEKKCVQNAPSSASVMKVHEIKNPYQVDVSYNYLDEGTANATISALDAGGYFVIHDITCA